MPTPCGPECGKRKSEYKARYTGSQLYRYRLLPPGTLLATRNADDESAQEFEFVKLKTHSMAGTSRLLIRVASLSDIATVQDLWREYWAGVRFSPDFQNFDEELRTLPGAYAAPEGRLLIAYVENVPAGTAALRPIDEHSCEAKRLYVRPNHRGKGIGRSLLERLVEESRMAGYKTMYGDTLESMTEALEMYARFGFQETEPYSANPTPGAIYLKLTI